MEKFEELKSQWKTQTNINPPINGYAEIVKQTKAIQRKQKITNVVLVMTILVLVMFFFYISAYNVLTVALALSLMLGVLIVRVILEILSIKTLKQLSPSMDANAFRQKLNSYYKSRIKTHYIFTPIIILLYGIGFIILLPYFKAALTSGFYTYVIVSGIIVFIVGGLLITNQIKKEIQTLRDINM